MTCPRPHTSKRESILNRGVLSPGGSTFAGFLQTYPKLMLSGSVGQIQVPGLTIQKHRDYTYICKDDKASLVLEDFSESLQLDKPRSLGWPRRCLRKSSRLSCSAIHSMWFSCSWRKNG